MDIGTHFSYTINESMDIYGPSNGEIYKIHVTSDEGLGLVYKEESKTLQAPHWVFMSDWIYTIRGTMESFQSPSKVS